MYINVAKRNIGNKILRDEVISMFKVINLYSIRRAMVSDNIIAVIRNARCIVSCRVVTRLHL